MDLPTLLHRLHELSAGRPLYLVGGSVRDLLMGRPVKDVDVALPGSVSAFGRRAAKALGGSFFYLRQADETARIVLAGDSVRDGGASQVSQVDLVALHGATLEEDLRRRDFTVNAMGLDLTQGAPELDGEPLIRALVDPFGGLKDLQEGRIRRCTPRSLPDDPLRTLRSVRFAAAFGWAIEAETEAQIRETGPSLQRVSAERIRDELFLMLQLSPVRAESALNLLDTLDLLEPALRGPAGPKGLDRVRRLQEHVSKLEEQLDADLDLQVTRYLDEEITPPRTRYAVLKLAALFGPGVAGLLNGEDRQAYQAQSESLRARLELSAAESQFIRRVWNAVPILSSSFHDASLDSTLIHRTFKRFGDVIPATLFLAAIGEGERPSSEIERTWLDAWFNEQEKFLPEPLLNGRELMGGLEKPGGPWLSEMISALQEAQATGEVRDLEAAWVFVRTKSGSGGEG